MPALLLAGYLITRLLNLGVLPMVSDEGTYITWGVRALHARSVEDWLASLEDGKQPLLAWLMPPFMALFPDRLVAGRLVSVLCGLVNLSLLVVLGRRLISPAAGWIAAGLYVIAPISLLHDRMALYDSLVTSGALLVLWGAISWAERPSAGRTAVLGLAMGLALLTKLSALFFLALVPLAVALWRSGALRRWWPLAQAYFLAAAIYSVLYVSPIVGNIQEGNFQRYSLTAGEMLRFPAGQWWSNARFIAGAAGTYLGWPLTATAIAGMILAFGRRGDKRGVRLATLWTVAPLLLFVFTAKLIYSRYFVFCFVTSFLPAAYLLTAMARPRRRPMAPGFPWPRGTPAAWLAGAIIAAPGVPFAALLLTDPPQAPWMNDRRYITDRFQYVESNYAGYGLPEVVGYLRQQAAQRPIVVLARNTTGMPRDGVTAYLQAWPNVALGFVAENESIETGLQGRPDAAYRLAARGADLYYVLSDAPDGEQERRFRRLNPAADLILEVAKPGGHSRFQLYHTRWTGSAGDVFLDPPPVFGDQIALRGYHLSATIARPGEALELTLYWEALTRPAKSYTVFNHVTGAGGVIWGQKDSPPVSGQHPTSRWRPGEAVADRFEVALKPDTPPGIYDLVTGLYEWASLQRLPVERDIRGALSGGGEDVAGDHVTLARITVLEP